jgi:hypothetical protein
MANNKIKHAKTPLFGQFRAATDVLHDTQVNRTENVLRPQIKIPNGPHMQRVPGAAHQRRGSIRVTSQNELSAMRSEMAD